MALPAAKAGDEIVATDTHIAIMPNGAQVRLQYAFKGVLAGALSKNVFIGGKAAATVGSTANNTVPHLPAAPKLPPGMVLAPSPVSFLMPPTNLGEICAGSDTVRINGKAAARDKDAVKTCHDPEGMKAVGKVQASGSVYIG